MKPILVFAGGLVSAGLCGWLFASVGVPLAWILGAMTGSAIWANLVGAGKGTRFARRAGQLIVGAATGAILTPDVLDEMVGLLPAMIAAAAVATPPRPRRTRSARSREGPRVAAPWRG